MSNIERIEFYVNSILTPYNGVSSYRVSTHDISDNRCVFMGSEIQSSSYQRPEYLSNDIVFYIPETHIMSDDRLLFLIALHCVAVLAAHFVPYGFQSSMYIACLIYISAHTVGSSIVQTIVEDWHDSTHYDMVFKTEKAKKIAFTNHIERESLKYPAQNPLSFTHLMTSCKELQQSAYLTQADCIEA